MSDNDFRREQPASPQGLQPASPQGLKDKLTESGGEIKQRAGDALKVSTEIAREKLREAVDTAKDVATDAAGRVQQQAHARQGAGADYVSRFAGNIRNAAHSFEDTPFAAQGVTLAADYVESAADKLRNGTFNDLVSGAADFARRQPAAFLGLSVLTGFAAVRFLRATAETSQPQHGLPDDAS